MTERYKLKLEHTNTKSSRIKCTLVTRASVLVHCYVAKLTNSLHSSAIKTSLAKIHQHKMIVGSTYTCTQSQVSNKLQSQHKVQ